MKEEEMTDTTKTQDQPTSTKSPTEERMNEILLHIKDLSKGLLMSGTLQVCKETELKDQIKFLIIEFDAIDALSKNIEKTSSG